MGDMDHMHNGIRIGLLYLKTMQHPAAGMYVEKCLDFIIRYEETCRAARVWSRRFHIFHDIFPFTTLYY
jgi:hypothetical protein